MLSTLQRQTVPVYIAKTNKSKAVAFALAIPYRKHFLYHTEKMSFLSSWGKGMPYIQSDPLLAI